MAQDIVPQIRLSGDPLLDIGLLVMANLALVGAAFWKSRRSKGQETHQGKRIIVIRADNLRIFEVTEGGTDETSHGSGGEPGDKVS